MHLVYLTNEEKKKITDDIIKNTNGLTKATEDLAKATGIISDLSNDINTKAGAIKEKASGEVIVVTDSDEAKPLGLAIDGKSEQNQYTGKNILVSTMKAGEKITITATKDDYYNIYPDIYADLKAGEYYTMSLSTDGTISNDKNIDSVEFFLLKDSGFEHTLNLSILHNKEFTVPVDGRYNLRLDVNKNGCTHSFWDIMVCHAEITDKTYEPYCGGIPSPNPSYPQEIRNIGVYDEASGKYAVEVKGTGKNLFNKNAPFIRGYTFDENGNLITKDDRQWGIHDQYIKVIPNEDYIVSGNFVPLNWSLRVTFYDVNKNTIKSEGYSNKDGKATFNTPKDTRYVRFACYKTNEEDFGTVQLELGTVATAYEPYKETTATVLLDEPLRNGDKAYWNGGSKIRVDRYRAVDVFDGSDDERWNKNYTNDGQFAMFGTMLKQKSKQTNDELCNQYIRKPILSGSENFGFDTSSSIGEVRVRPTDYATLSLADWKARLAENPITVEYTLATPITEEIDIDLGELSMFYPTTILSNDCNANMEVTYVVDTKTYIDKKFAELAATMS